MITATTKKCFSCGGIIKLELTDEETVVFCENYCFEKRKARPVRTTLGTGFFAEYIHKNGKSYLRTNKTNNFFKEAVINKVKKGIRVCMIGKNYEISELL